MLKKVNIPLLVLACFFVILNPLKGFSQGDETNFPKDQSKTVSRTLYGQASFYANKFEGRKTATGEKFGHANFTAACNILPLGTWVRVTNMRNGKSIVVRTNDRLHPKTKRIIDLTKAGAKKLGYVKNGLTRVKLEVLRKKPS